LSTVTEIGTASAIDPALDAAPVPRRRGRRIVLAFVALLVLLAIAAGVAGAGLYAWDAGYEGRVLPRVSVGGLDLSGMDRDAAVAAIAARYPYEEGQVVVRTPDGDVTIPFAGIGRRPDVDAVVDAALIHGRQGSILERAIGELRLAIDGGTVPDPAVILDETALTTKVEAAVGALHRYPTSATITMGPKGILITRARTGREADPAPAVKQALAAARDPSTTGDIVIPVSTTTTRPRVEDAAVFDARDEAVRMAKPIRIATKSKTWRIKAAEVRSWLRFAPAAGGTFTVELDESQIPANLKKAAKAVKNHEGKSGRVKFKVQTDYHPFRMKDTLPVVKRAAAAIAAGGGTPNIRTANGGLDANWMVRHGIPTVTFGAGQNEVHTVDEWINLDEYERACALAVRLATMG